tara:strand:- start:878 stop:1258 length:381 start_codon:yes stop_codon:yes gene_type:complete
MKNKIWKRKINPISASKFSYGEPMWRTEVTVADFGDGIVVFENGEWHNDWGSIVREWENKTNNELDVEQRLLFIDSVTTRYLPYNEYTERIEVVVYPRNMKDQYPEWQIIRLTERQTKIIKEREQE